MGNVAIVAEGIGKQYRIGAKKQGYETLRDTLMYALKSPLRRIARLSGKDGPSEEMFWALKDVSFEIKHGEVIGIIGRNGAGKSTLLKILSRITEPTTGRARIYGRVGSLLEVGTGFHPELTGRENIYLNGAVLGMTRAEISKRFDEIVDFSGIEKFLDTPVKRYSSGMFVRLAFSVAAHLEPEILLVDEVLAVGDVEFQKKCIGKMQDVAKGGRTVLFVSHNMAIVSRLCGETMWFDSGQISMKCATENAISAYLSMDGSNRGERKWDDLDSAPGSEQVRLKAVRILDSHGNRASVLPSRDPFLVEIDYTIIKPVRGLQVGFWLMTSEGVTVFVAGDKEDLDWLDRVREPGNYRSTSTIPGQLLNSGLYSLAVASDIAHATPVFVQENVLQFRVELTQIPVHSSGRPNGIFCPSLEWRVARLE